MNHYEFWVFSFFNSFDQPYPLIYGKPPPFCLSFQPTHHAQWEMFGFEACGVTARLLDPEMSRGATPQFSRDKRSNCAHPGTYLTDYSCYGTQTLLLPTCILMGYMSGLFNVRFQCCSSFYSSRTAQVRWLPGHISACKKQTNSRIIIPSAQNCCKLTHEQLGNAQSTCAR